MVAFEEKISKERDGRKDIQNISLRGTTPRSPITEFFQRSKPVGLAGVLSHILRCSQEKKVF